MITKNDSHNGNKDKRTKKILKIIPINIFQRYLKNQWSHKTRTETQREQAGKRKICWKLGCDCPSQKD